MNQIVTNVFFDYCKKKSKYNVDFDNNKLTKIKDKIGCSPGEKCLFSETYITFSLNTKIM